jgi:uncharacterized protein (TIGR02996 family)
MKAPERKKKEAAFLESILAQPLDDVHRLVYADWLEEQQDDPSRAELVRLAVRLGNMETGDPEASNVEARCRELQEKVDPRWAATILAPSQVHRLRRLTETSFGPIDELYSKKLYTSRCLHPPATRKAVLSAEKKLGFPLPPLLGLVYTCLGNGGGLLSLMGLRGGQTGFDDIGFHNKDIVAGYQGCVIFGRWQPDGDDRAPWPVGLVPIYDGLGCGMVDYVDCTTPVGAIWRSDSGDLSRRLESLEEYLVGRVNFWLPASVR